jgi:heptosyltransferase II
MPPIAIDQSAKCVAIVCPSWVGDTVMATPVLRAAREALPHARIVAVLRPGLDEILRGLPWIDATIACPMKGLGGVWRLGAVLRSAKPDAVIALPNSFRAALGMRLSGAGIRVGYDRDHRGWLLTHRFAPPPREKPIAMVEHYAQLAEFAFGVQAIDRRIALKTAPEEHAAADRLLEGVRQPFVLLNPGANRADKRWPAERFAAVADALAASRGVEVVVTGAPSETDIVSAVIAAAKTPIVSLAVRGVRLGSLKAVIERAALVITNDTGPRHFAAALGTPVVTLFGPTDHRWTTLVGANERLLLAEPFLPEELMADRFAKACAIGKIAVGDVVHAAGELLGRSALRIEP